MTVVTGGLVYPVELSEAVESSAPAGTSQDIDWSISNVQVLDLTEASGDVTVTFSNPTDGGVYHLITIRDTGGNDVAAWPSNIRWPGGIVPTLQSSSGGDVYDVLQFVYSADVDLYIGRDLSAAEAFVAPDAIGSSQLQNNAVTNAKLRDSAALSVIGRNTNTAGDPVDIVASANQQYLGRSGTTLVFKELDTFDLPPATLAGVVDFGTNSDYAEVTLLADWISADSFAYAVAVRGGTTDHPLADEDAVVERLQAVVVSNSDEAVTIGVYAPEGTWGQYVVTVIAFGGLP